MQTELRTRINIKVIGSATAIARQLAALYVRGAEQNTIAIFDGDQRSKEGDNIKHAKNMAENTKDAFNDWICQRISYLPGETWPEAWIVQKCAEAPEALAAILSLEVDELQEILEYGLQAGKHNEFYEIAKHVGLDRTQCLQSLTTAICTAFPSEFVEVVKAIEVALK